MFCQFQHTPGAGRAQTLLWAADVGFGVPERAQRQPHQRQERTQQQANADTPGGGLPVKTGAGPSDPSDARHDPVPKSRWPARDR